MKKRNIFIMIALCLSSLLFTNSANAQNKKAPKTKETFLEQTLPENAFLIENSIMYGLSTLVTDSFYDDVDSIWVPDIYTSVSPIRLQEMETTKILEWGIDTLGDIILDNGDANLVSQNRNILPEGIYGDILKHSYAPTLPQQQKYAFLFLTDRDYTFQELRMKFYKLQDINGYEVKLNLADPYSLECFLHSNPELIEEVMVENDFLEIFAIGVEDIFQMQTTVSLLAPIGRSKKTYSTSGFARSHLTKFNKASKKIHIQSGLSSKYSHELIVPAGSYILLTSRESTSL